MDLTRSRLGALLARGSHRSLRDDGLKDWLDSMRESEPAHPARIDRLAGQALRPIALAGGAVSALEMKWGQSPRPRGIRPRAPVRRLRDYGDTRSTTARA